MDHTLSFFVAHLQKLQHAESAVRCAIVRPGGELKMTNISENA